MKDSAAISLEHVGKQYRVFARPQDRLKQMIWGRIRPYFTPFHALNDINLSVGKGQTVGIIGRNGSGKSTLLQIICGTLQPTHGEVRVKGKISALLELGAGFNPEFSGRENVYLNAAILGLSKEEIAAKYDSIIQFSGLDEAHIEQPVKTYSSGMYVRLAFSVAITVDPDILIIDEALAVGDEGFQRRCFARIKELQENGTTILFVSHSAQSIIELCERALLLDEGELLCEGAPKDMISAYHRLIYAPRDQRPDIRQQLKAGQISAETMTASMVNDSGVEATNRDRIEYAPNGGMIESYYLTDVTGNKVQTLETGGRYQFHYTVHLSEAASQPKFGMLIKTKRGVNLGGAAAEHYYHLGKTLDAGDTRELCFEFDCPLRPGNYFMNCGFTKQADGDEVFVHRILDALEFKVIDPNPNPDIAPAGHIDLNITVQGCT